ncbi:restriction endonuclease subunit S [Segatella copri]|uniref:Restriction endonuclease subunit S n=2 Tax=Segatella copri TaxID=165179 RepID=A0AAW5V1D5_9BACT|nr:restriction endonuclease subunit S [Segatella copri]MCW4141717.1 restriction endonuclease subunit S [Segatella copri]MCW4166091.1 restriction endonuclease subunit S [Segatella copri]
MKNLETLIQELCPNGVEFVKLGDCCTFKRGMTITAKNAIPGDVPVLAGGQKPAYYHNVANRTGETIVVAGSGAYAGFVSYWTVPVFLSDSFSVEPDDRLVVKFVYYFLKNIQQKIFATKKGSGVPHVHGSSIEKFEIPLPPIEVQTEIVRILDKFTSLEAELEAELDCRKRQYEYYRDKLLSFDNVGGQEVTISKIGDIGRICMCKRIMKNQTNSESGIPFYKIGTFGKVADAYISNDVYEEYKKLYSYPKKGDILMSASGTIGRTVVFNGKPSYFQDSNIVWVDNDETKVFNSYLNYYYQIIEWKTQGGTIKRLYNNLLAGATIKYPSLEEQHRIVSILDRFESLTTSLQSGLPAEIVARRQQYEHYRDKLLTFKRKGAA